MAKQIRDEAYYQKRIKETENRRKRILDEDRKVKLEFEEWKKSQIIALLDKYSLIEKISETNLWLFDSKFKEILEVLDKDKKKVKEYSKEETEEEVNSNEEE